MFQLMFATLLYTLYNLYVIDNMPKIKMLCYGVLCQNHASGATYDKL
jgi:hypothetical protein